MMYLDEKIVIEVGEEGGHSFEDLQLLLRLECQFFMYEDQLVVAHCLFQFPEGVVLIFHLH